MSSKKVTPSTTLETLLAPDSSKRKFWSVYKPLKDQIMLGELTHDSPITEQSLAKEFDCSQGTIRETLLCLEKEGLVDRRGYQGTYITRISDVEAILILRVRLTLECEGIVRTCRTITDDQIHYLRDMALAYIDASKTCNIVTAAEVDRMFHQHLFNMADLPMLRASLGRTLLQLHRFAISRRQNVTLWSMPEQCPHMGILDAIAERDANLAQERLQNHVLQFFKKFADDVYSKAIENDEINGPVELRKLTA